MPKLGKFVITMLIEILATVGIVYLIFSFATTFDKKMELKEQVTVDDVIVYCGEPGVKQIIYNDSDKTTTIICYRKNELKE